MGIDGRIGYRSWTVRGTSAEVRVTDPSRLDAACAITDLRIGLVRDAIDPRDERSELTRLRGRAEQGARVSPILADLVTVALDAAVASGGAVDPTLGSAGRGLRLVDGGTVRPARWRSVRLEGDLLLVPDGVELDLDATAMARTADAIAATAAATLRCGVLVDLDGDVASRGPAPIGGWRIAPRELPFALTLPGGRALATSRSRPSAHPSGEALHHILDPRTGRPVVPVWRAVTVAADTAVRSATLTTAAIVDGTTALHRLRASRFPARLVDAAGGVTTLNGWPDEQRRAA